MQNNLVTPLRIPRKYILHKHEKFLKATYLLSNFAFYVLEYDLLYLNEHLFETRLKPMFHKIMYA